LPINGDIGRFVFSGEINFITSGAENHKPEQIDGAVKQVFSSIKKNAGCAGRAKLYDLPYKITYN
jgi:hypothetical protein